MSDEERVCQYHYDGTCALGGVCLGSVGCPDYQISLQREAERRAAILAENARVSRAKWDKRHMSTCSCRLRTPDYDEFRRTVARSGLTAHALLRLFVAVTIMEGGGKITPGLRRDVLRMPRCKGGQD